MASFVAFWVYVILTAISFVYFWMTSPLSSRTKLRLSVYSLLFAILWGWLVWWLIKHNHPVLAWIVVLLPYILSLLAMMFAGNYVLSRLNMFERQYGPVY